jgi:Uma2 family endonuclease
MDELGDRACFTQAPEICVEVLSPANSDAEIQEKTALYFDAGAREVWLCDLGGHMKFSARDQSTPLEDSKVWTGLPKHIEFVS